MMNDKPTTITAGRLAAETSPRAEIRKRYEDYKARSDKDGLTSLSYVDWLETTHLTTVEWEDQRIIRLEQQLADAQRELTTLTARAEQAEASAAVMRTELTEWRKYPDCPYCEGTGVVVVGWDNEVYENIEGDCPHCKGSGLTNDLPEVPTAGADLLDQLATVTRERDALRKDNLDLAARLQDNVLNHLTKRQATKFIRKEMVEIIKQLMGLRKAAQEAKDAK